MLKMLLASTSSPYPFQLKSFGLNSIFSNCFVNDIMCVIDYVDTGAGNSSLIMDLWKLLSDLDSQQNSMGESYYRALVSV